MSNNIVIVGGGYAGTQIAKALEKQLAKSNDTKHRIILVEKVNIKKTREILKTN
jgi:NADH dehydrogenase FAD-containing subunit